jgi:predicted enzyme related to lactoylglutathione lyase
MNRSSATAGQDERPSGQLLFAGITVRNFREAAEWYERFFDRPPDVVAVPEQEVMWHVAETAWLYIVVDAERAGNGLVAILVADLDGSISALAERGVSVGAPQIVGGGRKATAIDPAGNAISLIQVPR